MHAGKAFEKLKLALVAAPVLAIPDPADPFDLIELTPAAMA